MAEGDPGDLAAAYVTILPDMDEFAADLAASLEEITRGMRPKVHVEADLDLSGIEAKLEALASQAFTVHIGVDSSRLRSGLLMADGILEAWASQDFKAKLGVDASGLRAALAAAEDGLALPPLIQKIHVIPDPAGAAEAGAIDQAVIDAMGGGSGRGNESQLSFLSPAANDAIGLATRDYLQHGIDSAVTRIAATALMNAKSEGIALTQDQVNELSGARTKIAAADTAGEMGLSTVLRASQGTGVGGNDVGPFLADEGPASASWLASLSQSLKGFGTQLGRSGLPTDVADAYKPQMQDIAESLEGEVSKATAISIGEELANMKRDLNLKSIPYLKQGAEGTPGFFGDVGEAATEDISPSDADMTKAKTGLATLLTQIMAAKALSADTRTNLFNSAADLNRLLAGESSSSNLDKAVAATTTLQGALADARTAALLASGPAGGGGGGGLRTAAVGTAAAASSGGGGGGFFTGLASLFGGGGDDPNATGKGILAGVTGFGQGHVPGSGVSRWIPALPFLAGAGSIGSMMGFGPEHVVTTLGGIAGSAVSGIAGAGLLAAGAGAVAGVGMGTDLAGTGQALGDTKTTVTALTALSTAVHQFGLGSEQAVAATVALNTSLAGFSPVAQGAVLKAAEMTQTFEKSFDRATGLAEKYGAEIIQSAIQVGGAYLPVIGNFAAQNTLMIKNSLTGPNGLFNWLKSAQQGGGLDIFTQLEQTFQKGLPDAMGAATNGIEVFAKAISYLSTYTGGFMKELNDEFQKYNNAWGTNKIDGEMSKMIGNFETWKDFLKELVVDLHDIFKDDAGLGGSIIQTLTQMLTELNQWITSTKGHDELTSLFTVHKEQVLALLGLLPPLVKALAPMLHIMPAMTALTLPFINAIVNLLTALETLPGGIGPAVAAFAGLFLILGKTAGWANSFGFFKTIFSAVLPGIGAAVEGMVGMDAAMASTSAAAVALKYALGIGVVGALILIAYGLDEVFKHFGTFDGVVATATVAVGLFMAAWKLGYLEDISAGIAGIITKLTASKVATDVATGATEASAVATEEAAAAATVGIDGVAAAWAKAGVGAVSMAEEVAGATAEVEAEAAAQIASINGIAAAWSRAGAVALAGGAEEGVGGAEGAAGGLAGAAGGLAGGAEAEGAAGVGLLTEAEVGAGAAGTGLLATLGGISAVVPPLAIAVGVAAVGFGLLALHTHAVNDAMKEVPSTATSATTTMADLADRYVKINSLINANVKGSSGFLGGFTGIFTGSNDQYNALLGTLGKTSQQILNLKDNTSYLSDRFHITGQDADTLASQLGVNLTQAMSPTGEAFHKIETAIEQMSAQAGIASSALFYLAQSSGESASQISNAMSQAAQNAQQLMDTLTNIPTGATAFQANASQAAATALSNAQQSQQLNQAIAQAQQQYAQDAASGAASVTAAAQSAAQPGATPGGLAQAQQSAASQLASDTTAIQSAKTALANFNQTTAQTAQATAAALSIPPAAILASMQSTLQQASTFNTDINKLMAAGFSPQVVNQIIGAGVTNGLATAQGLLQGFVSDGGKAYVSQINQANTALSLVSMQAIEQAKLMQDALLPKTSTKTAMQEPVAMEAFQNMAAVNPTAAENGAGVVTESFLKSTGMTAGQLGALMAQYGLTLTGVVNRTSKGMTYVVTQAQAQQQTQMNEYLEALSTTTSKAQRAAMGAGTFTPPKASSDGAKAAGTKAGTDVGTAVANGVASGAKAGMGPNTLTGPLAQSVLGGHALLTTAGKAAGTSAANGAKDGGTAGAKPAGKALIEGIIDGIKGSQPALNKAVLASVKTSIDTDKSQVGGQSLGVALVHGIEDGISQSQTALNTAVIKSIKTAISDDVGQVGGQSLGVALVNGIVAGISANAGKITSAMTSAVSGGIQASQNLAANSPMPTGTAAAKGGNTIAPTYNMSVINAQGMNQTQLASAIQAGVQQANEELLTLVNAHGG